MKYNVHIYAVVRVKVPGVEAESHKEAMEKATKQVDLYSTFDWEGGNEINGGITATEFAEEINGYLVDEEGDEEYANSTYYDGSMRDPEIFQPDGQCKAHGDWSCGECEREAEENLR